MRVPHGHAVSIASLGALLVLASCAPGVYTSDGTTTYLGFSVGVESAPPPPQLVYAEQPRYIPVEASRVQVVEAPDPNYDEFSYQGTFYLYANGFWYRSASYNGPFSVIEVRRVPRAVLEVPDQHWRHRPHWDRGQHRGQNDRGDRGNGSGNDH